MYLACLKLEAFDVPVVMQSARNDKMRINSQRHLGAAMEQAAVSFLSPPPALSTKFPTLSSSSSVHSFHDVFPSTLVQLMLTCFLFALLDLPTFPCALPFILLMCASVLSPVLHSGGSRQIV